MCAPVFRGGSAITERSSGGGCYSGGFVPECRGQARCGPGTRLAVEVDGRAPLMKRKKYEAELRKLQVELCHLQRWVKEKGKRIVIVFEGRDGAGKGAPSGRSPSGSARACSGWWRCRPHRTARRPMYMQRYMQHFPTAGEVVIFDRSWYNRAGVERVMGFCSDEQDRALPGPLPRRRKVHDRRRRDADQTLARSEPG